MLAQTSIDLARGYAKDGGIQLTPAQLRQLKEIEKLVKKK
jgi:hypothetical protein